MLLTITSRRKSKGRPVTWRLIKKDLFEEAYTTIKEMIMEGSLKPGEKDWFKSRSPENWALAGPQSCMH
ncbi:MAG: hypothetical protein ACOX6A_05960 [Atribacter sp.]|uniref:hypothetical protein n=1 Tax=Atribacter sp. TaxID=2847780 RepID=UPI003D970801